MLSTENPPPDPSCSSSQVSQLKTGFCRDERLAVDLKNSGNTTPLLPKFSIRDYVFGARSKCIENHWPFSSKNLQLCLKRGLKDILPPFDFAGESSTVEPSVFDVNVSEFDDHRLCASFDNVGEKLDLDVENIELSGLEKDREHPSTSNSRSSSDINPVTKIKGPHLEAQAENLPQPSPVKPQVSDPQDFNKVEINSVKKCRLIVKLSNVVQPKPMNEELLVTASVASEPMASKVCPVCKTFSSSSNTTLNAHIDQCLLGESPIKWTDNSKVIKNIIKPRKRLMVDIYKTSLHCTLEDLDRRNGTNWALNLDVPVPDMESCARDNNCIPSVDGKDKNGEGAVYFDSNGTKLRILSKFSEQQLNINGEHCVARKLVKTAEGSRCLSIKKKKHMVQSHKLLKRPSSERSRSCGLDNFPEAYKARERRISTEEDEKEELSQHVDACDQMKLDGFGVINQWVGSKRTCLKKKIDLEHEKQRQEGTKRNLEPSKKMPLVGDEFVKRNCDLGHERKGNLCFDSDYEYRLRKGVEFSLLESRDRRGKESNLMHGVQSRKDGSSVCKRFPDSPDVTENHASSQGNKKMRSAGPDVNGDGSFTSPRMSRHDTVLPEGKNAAWPPKKTSLDRMVLSGGKKLLLMRKKLSSVRHASHSQSIVSGKDALAFKKPGWCRMPRSDEEISTLTSTLLVNDYQVATLGENATQLEKASRKSLINRATVLKNQEKKEGFVSTSKHSDAVVKVSHTQAECDSLQMEQMDSFVAGDVPSGSPDVLDAAKVVEVQDGFVCEATSKLSAAEACVTSVKSLDSRLLGLARLSDDETGSQHYVKASEGRASVATIGQENFSADEVGEGAAFTSNAPLVSETNPSEACGEYFVDVDQIPIPGPPGSFLPSLDRMGSEELQGNSSLTTCRIFSSEDEHELVDMDASNSPVSATSFASNSITGRSDSVTLENLAMLSNGIQHESSSEDRTDPIIESCAPFEQAEGVQEKPELYEWRANAILPESRFKNRQLCRCARKERVTQNDSFSNHESELVRSRTMAFLLPHSIEDKRMDLGRADKPYHFNLRPEIPPEKDATPEAEKYIANSQKGAACESPSPSGCNSVLRLMGKNLMVVTKEENPLNDHLALKSGASPLGNVQTEQSLFHNHSSQDRSMLGDLETCTVPQRLDFSLSDGSRMHTIYRTPHLLLPHPSDRCHFVVSGVGSHITLDTPSRPEIKQVPNYRFL